ncbi:STAS domain-containing protein [Mycobacterium sp. ITM-2016-00318]|uniref:STAS domain-containing protein n=1 Tax=Mycobacterium sp. ITM-2016-00318 TaxID=2099693 RepID=UPI000CF9FBC7|nr:STAS domain-containing protein [Mycobacterium sp. ITM-2016-00318]WNG94420.1 STAS domain-containing protein [Mycobacterium sp. ITM-2016-00318]
MATALNIETQDRGDGTLVLTATGEIDLSNIDAFSGALSAAGTDGASLIVDLSDVLYLDSGAINVLFANAGRIRLIANPVLMPVLQISGLTDVASVEPAA